MVCHGFTSAFTPASALPGVRKGAFAASRRFEVADSLASCPKGIAESRGPHRAQKGCARGLTDAHRCVSIVNVGL